MNKAVSCAIQADTRHHSAARRSISPRTGAPEKRPATVRNLGWAEYWQRRGMASAEGRQGLQGRRQPVFVELLAFLWSTICAVQALLDLAGIYRAWNVKYNSWSVFGQDHVAKVLLNFPMGETHDAIGDAVKSIRLFNLSQQLQQNPAAWQQTQVSLQHSCAIL